MRARLLIAVFMTAFVLANQAHAANQSTGVVLVASNKACEKACRDKVSSCKSKCGRASAAGVGQCKTNCDLAKRACYKTC